MDLVGYLEALPRVAISRLYTSPWTCQAVLRGLPPIAKLYVLRMVPIENPLPNSLIEEWCLPEGVLKQRAALQKLERLQILQPGPVRAGEETWKLQPDFQKELRAYIYDGRGGPQQEDIPDEVLAAAPSRAALDKYSNGQWEALLLYLVGSSDRPARPPPLLEKAMQLHVDTLLESAKLLSLEGGREITEEGFKFLLLDTYNQLWLLLRQYTEAAAKRSGAALASVVSFLLQLGFQGVATPLPTAKLNDLERSIAADLAHLGLLLPFRAAGEIWLSPTRMAIALSGGQSAEAQKEVTDGFIVVETNYRVLAYTSSPLKYAILRLFVRCDVILPNVFIGTLTRESVTDALRSGISHEQIVTYLTQHADPHIADNVPIVPAVVADQIRLWQAEMTRVQHYKATLYDDFESDEVFKRVAQHARDLGTWLWEDPMRRRLVARQEGHPALRDFIKSTR